MDPASLATGLKLGNGAFTALQNGAVGTKSALRRLRLAGIVDIEWLKLEANGKDGLTANQIEDVELFLTSPRVRPLLSFAALCSALEPPNAAASLMVDASQNFDSEVTRWNIESRGGWDKQSPALWAKICEIYRGTLPGVANLLEVQDEIANFTSFVSSPIVTQSRGESSASEFVARLAELAPDLDRIVGADILARTVARQIAAALDEQPLISHTQTDYFTDFDKLYVKQTFRDIQTDDAYPSELFMSSGSPFRVVIQGAPGAGKTTFLRHLSQQSANADVRTPPIGCVTISCRDYVRDGWNQSLSQYLRAHLASEFSVAVDDRQMNDLLLLAKLHLVLDGLDEVPQHDQRARLVQRIQAFASNFPALSLIVTSREVGYERAPLSSGLFRHVRLDEFTYTQINAYVDRWFAIAGRKDLATSFLEDSETIRDIRKNPLLLSLLCVLYREHGAIPLNRRAVYTQCAQLLFHRWDSHRQMVQHEAMPRYGDRLMQEIARWFYTTPSTSGGLDEKVLAKVVANFMRDSLGFHQDDADFSAGDFLNFCAGRAWLLGKIGITQSGVRIFGFIHRTFYEYFAAEAFARAATGPEDVAARILDAYKSDPSSVLPELLIQAYDEYHERGAALVYEQPALMNGPISLLLILMQGAILPSYARVRAFDRLVSPQMASKIALDDCRSLFAITSSSRKHFVTDYIEAESGTSARHLLTYAWASLQLSGGVTDRHVREWGGDLERLIRRFPNEVLGSTAPVVQNWLVMQDIDVADQDGSVWKYLVCDSMAGLVPGAAWWMFDALFLRRIDVDRASQINRRVRRMVQHVARDGFPRKVLQSVASVLELYAVDFEQWDFRISGRDAGWQIGPRSLLVVLLLALSEAELVRSGDLQAVSRKFGGNVSHLVQERGAIVRGGAPVLTPAAENVVSLLPKFVGRWARGDISLVAESRSAGS